MCMVLKIGTAGHYVSAGILLLQKSSLAVRITQQQRTAPCAMACVFGRVGYCITASLHSLLQYSLTASLCPVEQSLWWMT